MSAPFTRTLIVAGTDTGVGKTVIAAALAGALNAYYWKPIQSGLDGETDSEMVRRLSGLRPERVLPEAYRLRVPASPHIAARMDGVEIDVDGLTPPDALPPSRAGSTLVIEGAGGLMVPLTSRTLQIDLYARWKHPVVLVARTALGTINHSLLSIEALRRRDVPIAGIAFSGESEPEVEMTIVEMGQVRRLGRLPHLDHLDAASLRAAFAACFDLRALAP